jgi:hypothetical protein
MRFVVPSFPFLRRRSDRTPVRTQDPADLGTAFGMEACLDEGRQANDGYAQLESQRAHPPLDNPMAWVQRARG